MTNLIRINEIYLLCRCYYRKTISTPYPYALMTLVGRRWFFLQTIYSIAPRSQTNFAIHTISRYLTIIIYIPENLLSTHLQTTNYPMGRLRDFKMPSVPLYTSYIILKILENSERNYDATRKQTYITLM